MASVLTIVFSALFVVTGYTAVLAIGAAVVLGQLLMATLPPPVDANGVPIEARPMVPIAVGSLVATALMLWPEVLVGADGTTAVESETATSGFQLGLAPGVAVALMAALVVQMRRKDGRRLLVASLTYAVGAAALAVCLSVWVTIPTLADGDPILASACAGAAVAALVWLVPGPRGLIGTAAAVLGGVAGGVFGYLVADGVSTDFGAALGLFAGIMVAVGRAAAEVWVPDVRGRIGFIGLAPLALAGPIVYLVGQFYIL